ncbi:hypothetical protein Peur_027994 [Populus x canadensis]
MVMCGCSSQSDHQFVDDMVDEYDDGSFDQLFEKHRQETDDNDWAFMLVQKKLVMALLRTRNIGTVKGELSQPGSISPPGTSCCSARFTPPIGTLPVIPNKMKRSGRRDQRFIIHQKSTGSEEEEAESTSVSSRKERGAGILIGFVNKNKYSKTEIHEEEEEKPRTSERRKRGPKALVLDLGFDFSNEVKAPMGEDGDTDFKSRIKKKLYHTDTSCHHDRFTMPWRQINECENLLNDDEKRDIVRIGDDIGVTLVELGLGDTRDGMITDQLRLKQWNMGKNSYYALRSGWKDVMLRNVGVLQQNDYVQIYSFRRNKELWFVLFKESDHLQGRTNGVFEGLMHASDRTL